MERYEKVVDSFLGQGSFGIVEKCARKTDGKVFACKTIRFRNNDKHRASALQEYAILSRLDHPHIVSYVDIVWEPTAVQIFMSFCGGGSLADFIESRDQRVSERYIWTTFLQLSSALLYCHNGILLHDDGSMTGGVWDWDPILHRDIKPGNILLSTGTETESVTIKLGDFGLSTFINFEKAPSTYAGTKQYLAPEITRSQQAGTFWTKMCDMFSLGCSIWELSSLQAPFSGHMDSDDVYQDLPITYGGKLNTIVKACMSARPERRPDALDLMRSIRRHQPASQSDGPDAEIQQDVSGHETAKNSPTGQPADMHFTRGQVCEAIEALDTQSTKPRAWRSYSDRIRLSEATELLDIRPSKSFQEVLFATHARDTIEQPEGQVAEQYRELASSSEVSLAGEATNLHQKAEAGLSIEDSRVSVPSARPTQESTPLQPRQSGSRLDQSHEMVKEGPQKSEALDMDSSGLVNDEVDGAETIAGPQELSLPQIVLIRTACSRTIELTVPSMMLVYNLKHKLTKEGYVKPENQVLFHGRTLLEDHMPLSRYQIVYDNVLDVSTVFAAQRLRSNHMITIHLKTKHGKTKTISIAADSPCEAIKAIVWERDGTPIGVQSLTHYGVPLEDWKSLKDFFIIDGSNVDIEVPLSEMLSPPEPKSPPSAIEQLRRRRQHKPSKSNGAKRTLSRLFNL